MELLSQKAQPVGPAPPTRQTAAPGGLTAGAPTPSLRQTAVPNELTTRALTPSPRQAAAQVATGASPPRQIDVHVRGISAEQLNLPATVTVAPASVDWTKPVTILLGVINLIVVCLFAITTRRDKARERRADQENEVDAFWIQKLIFEPHFQTLMNFFSDTEREMREYKTACDWHASDVVQQGEGYMEQFSVRVDDVSRKVIEPLHTISPSLSNQVAAEIDTIQDTVTDFFSRYAIPDDTLLTSFRTQQGSFWKTLFRGHKKHAMSRVQS